MTEKVQADKRMLISLRKNELGRLVEMPELSPEEIQHITPIGEPRVLVVSQQTYRSNDLKKKALEDAPNGSNAYLTGKAVATSDKHYVPVQYHKVPTISIQRAITRKLSSIGFP